MKKKVRFYFNIVLLSVWILAMSALVGMFFVFMQGYLLNSPVEMLFYAAIILVALVAAIFSEIGEERLLLRYFTLYNIFRKKIYIGSKVFGYNSMSKKYRWGRVICLKERWGYKWLDLEGGSSVRRLRSERYTWCLLCAMLRFKTFLSENVWFVIIWDSQFWLSFLILKNLLWYNIWYEFMKKN